jgi:hypothetical protein
MSDDKFKANDWFLQTTNAGIVVTSPRGLPLISAKTNVKAKKKSSGIQGNIEGIPLALPISAGSGVWPFWRGKKTKRRCESIIPRLRKAGNKGSGTADNFSSPFKNGQTPEPSAWRTARVVPVFIVARRQFLFRLIVVKTAFSLSPG